MAKYLTLFDTHSSYEEYIDGPDAILPNVSYCEDVKDVHFNPEHDYTKDYLTFTAKENGTFKFSGSTTANTIQYSLDNGTTWNNLAHDTNTPTVGSNLTIDIGIGKFISSGLFDTEGNIMSLLYGDNFAGHLSTDDDTFRRLFSGCTGLIAAENLVLPATALTRGCYQYMFQGCTSLTTAPELPATTLTEECYNYMFNGCTSLTTAPELPATTLSGSCYDSMFYGCTSLTSAPELPATTLADWCYHSMFEGCTSLTTAPELPATTLAQFCYGNMFYGCSSLTYIKCLATDISAWGCTRDWVDGVASTGTFVKNPSMSSWEIDVTGIPSGWTVQDAS